MTFSVPSGGYWTTCIRIVAESQGSYAGDRRCLFANVYKDGTGVVEFLRHEDMKYVIKKLDDSRFRSGEVAYIRVREDSTNEERRGGDYHDRYSPHIRRGTPTNSPVQRRFSRLRSFN